MLRGFEEIVNFFNLVNKIFQKVVSFVTGVYENVSFRWFKSSRKGKVYHIKLIFDDWLNKILRL